MCAWKVLLGELLSDLLLVSILGGDFMGRKSWEGMRVWNGVPGGVLFDLLLVSILTRECMRRKV